MSVTIRLSRIGKRNAPAYRIVVANTKDKRNGRPLEVLGYYNPSNTPELFEIDKEKYNDWLSKGALVTDAVEKLVAGEYEFEPYTRQNEEDKKKKDTVEESGEKTEEVAVEQEGATEASDESADESNDAAPEATQDNGAEQPQE